MQGKEKRLIRNEPLNSGQLSAVALPFYAAVGDLITINERLVVITELRASSFNYKVSGCEYAAFHSSIRDIQIMDEKITKLYIA